MRSSAQQAGSLQQELSAPERFFVAHQRSELLTRIVEGHLRRRSPLMSTRFVTSSGLLIIALLVVVAVVTVLVTPDPSDDVQGILRPHKVIKTHGLATMFGIAMVLAFVERSYTTSSQDVTSQNLLKLICTYRC